MWTVKRSLLLSRNRILKIRPIRVDQSPPVANLCHLAKFLDTLLTGKIMNYLELNELLSLLQSGFRARHRTQTALLNLLEDVHFTGEKKKVTVLILFDFSKVFDSLSHRIFLVWLREMNFSGDSLRLIHSYLTDRSQAVLDLVGTTTKFMSNTTGIPQGSSLGPVLFLAYINSVLQALNFTSSTCALFAGNLQCHCSDRHGRLANVIEALNRDATSILDWAAASGLTVNAAKTKAISLVVQAPASQWSKKFF
ncbi:hypothetical protein TKK_0008775 [Trichogramma kaykai]